MTIDRCTPADLNTLRQVASEGFVETYAHANTEENMRRYLEEHFSPQRLARELEDPLVRYYLLREKRCPAGYIRLNEGSAQTDPQGENALEIERIYVLRAFQGKGYGRRLIQQGLRVARELGKACVWLGVWEENTNAIQFYEHSGFVRAGSHSFFLGGEEQTDFIMRYALDA